MPATYHIPNEFWETPIGALALRAHMWARRDELITASEAADLCGKSTQALSQLADRGKLATYSDPSEPNPQRRTRYQKSQVMALRHAAAKAKATKAKSSR
jgi:hypothetical protein